MNRFVWRLQRILDLKIREEKLKKAELFELTNKVIKSREELFRKQGILENLLRQVGGGKERGLLEQEFVMKSCEINKKVIDGLKKKTRLLEEQRKEKMADFLKVRKFREALEKLRAKARQRFLKEQEKLEQKQLDEDATISFVRKAAHQEL